MPLDTRASSDDGRWRPNELFALRAGDVSRACSCALLSGPFGGGALKTVSHYQPRRLVTPFGSVIRVGVCVRALKVFTGKPSLTTWPLATYQHGKFAGEGGRVNNNAWFFITFAASQLAALLISTLKPF